MTPNAGKPRRTASRLWYLLFLPPFAGLLWPFYLRAEPALLGFPFFYWYQFAWLIASAILTWIVFVATRERSDG